jgi:hypothetical protein
MSQEEAPTLYRSTVSRAWIHMRTSAGKAQMQELIKRLTTLLDGMGLGEEVRPGTVEASMLTSRDWGRLRGMRDLVPWRRGWRP